jgi:hypothetical protein
MNAKSKRLQRKGELLHRPAFRRTTLGKLRDASFWTAIPNAVAFCKELSPYDRSVYAAILYHVDLGENKSTAAVRETVIAKMTGMSERQVRRGVTKLRELRLITTVQRAVKKVSMYTIGEVPEGMIKAAKAEGYKSERK